MQPHGGYRSLKSYQASEIIYDLTVEFCNKYVHTTYGSNKSYKTYSRTHDQMVQAARSGKQNIAEGSSASGASRQTELKLVSVARASLEELLLDYEDFLRQQGLKIWDKSDFRAQEIRALAYRSDKSYTTYETYMTNPESAANCLICLINQANYLLDQQIKSLEKQFVKEGDYQENLRYERKEEVKKQLFGLTDDEEFLTRFGLKKLPNGRVVGDKE